MAAKTQVPAAKAPENNEAVPELHEIGRLRVMKNLSRAVFGGVCAAEGWKPGKRVAEDAFDRAVAAFTGSPIDGRTVKKKEAG